jgi:plasmid stability protein
MASITIRNLDDALKSRLRLRAAHHGHSMEEEARELLRAGLAVDTGRGPNLAESIRKHIDPIGGVELVLPPREPVRRPPKLTK